jgi:hypothetical protein
MAMFRLGIRSLPGNRNLPVEGASVHKEGAPISIFGSDVEKKNYGRGFGTGQLGISTRLAECRPQVKYVPPTK